jgi:hypothetical protein
MVKVWEVVVGATLAVGGVCALTQWGWLPLLAAGLLTAVLVSVFVAAFVAGTMRLRRIVIIGPIAAAAAIAALGLVRTLGMIGVVVLIVLTLTSPFVVRRLSTLLPARQQTPQSSMPSAPEIEQLVDTEPEPDAVTLDDTGLCLAWRRSYLRLEGAGSMASRLAIVKQRQAYLDELEHRHPEEFAEWLRRARASGNPLPYMQKASDRHAREDASEDQEKDHG